MISFVYLEVKALYHKEHKGLHKEHYTKGNKSNTYTSYQ
ncbi:hypothetical protein KL86DYS1_11271 [uncultured Dysgonomonas sp.]|uniref:Uncharacterized protein n=1 Tax=uncultured Dysgonomonas sp. TaxID=206096 RepID=A0A212J6B7_9BACT|nr:hypothetical protein KL86DYS1_11271 [uncultured Dysgonomonas sp.]